jgi:hypothetical protein
MHRTTRPHHSPMGFHRSPMAAWRQPHPRAETPRASAVNTAPMDNAAATRPRVRAAAMEARAKTEATMVHAAPEAARAHNATACSHAGWEDAADAARTGNRAARGRNASGCSPAEVVSKAASVDARLTAQAKCAARATGAAGSANPGRAPPDFTARAAPARATLYRAGGAARAARASQAPQRTLAAAEDRPARRAVDSKHVPRARASRSRFSAAMLVRAIS